MLEIGFLCKFTDFIVDESIKTKGLEPLKYIGYAFSFIYGILTAYVMTTTPVLAPLGFAIILALLFTKKLDHITHYIGIATIFLFLALWGFPQITFTYMIVFLVFAILDEIVNDLADLGKVKGPFRLFFKYRLSLELMAFIISWWLGEWIVFISILFFDIGYSVTRKVMDMLLEKYKRSQGLVQ
jgi:hypothetical protein